MGTLHNLPLLCATLILASLMPEPAHVETVKHSNCSEQEQTVEHGRPDGSLSSQSTAGTLSTRVEAGNGRVSAGTDIGQAQGADNKARGNDGNDGAHAGRSVTATSSNGSSASSSVSSSSSGSGTTAAAGSGDCVIISD